MREHTRLPLIAKMEKPQAVERAEEIIRAADCVMVARGDLGIELPIEQVPIVQKQLLELAGWMARPSITATQMLDSMVTSSRPTRAEVADVANAILDGTDAVMLSQETAVGAYPVEAVAMMAAVAVQAESIAPYERWNAVARAPHRVRPRLHARPQPLRSPRASCAWTRWSCPTLSGRSARLVSAHRPTVPIYALSPGRETVRRCGLMWGVQAASMPPPRDDRGADRRRRPARGGARLVRARPARRDHRRAALRPAGHDQPGADPGALSVHRRPLAGAQTPAVARP